MRLRIHYSKLMLHELVSNVHMFFFFQAEDGIRDSSVTGVQTCVLLKEEDGIRDSSVTGVQTCALPISNVVRPSQVARSPAANAASASWRGTWRRGAAAPHWRCVGTTADRRG